MPSSKVVPRGNGVRRAPAHALLLAILALSAPARAQQLVNGFAVERFYPSAPGAGWMVMDDLQMHGQLGGAVAVTGGYAYRPLRVKDGPYALDVVRHEAFTDVGVAITYDRYRVYLNLTSPLVIKGQSGTVGDYQYAAPDVTLSEIPDLVSDARLGFDARLIGEANSAWRWGLGGQLIVPNGNRSDYDTDGRLRAMLRSLFAADLGLLAASAQLCVHVRTLDDSPAPQSPRGSELLFGLALGPAFAVDTAKSVRAVIGPEVFGATAFNGFAGESSTALEALLTGRLEGTAEKGAQVRVKLSTGRGLIQRFGAPEWRVLFGLEMFDRGE